MKAKSLSANILKNTIQTWARFCASHPNFKWTKHDSNAMFLINQTVRKASHKQYLKYKAKKSKRLFKMQGTALFEANGIDDAFKQLARYFSSLAEMEDLDDVEEIFFSGSDLSINPCYDDKIKETRTE